jgi:hypothetical protein
MTEPDCCSSESKETHVGAVAGRRAEAMKRNIIPLPAQRAARPAVAERLYEAIIYLERLSVD